MNEIVNGEIRDPREYYPHISDWLVDILFASVQKDRTKRIQSSDEFTKRLLSKEGKAAVMGTADKTIIEEPKTEIKEPKKTVTPLPDPVQTKPEPVKTIKPVKPRSSNKKILLFGGIGLIAAVIIYFAVTSNSKPDPYDPFFEEDSILIFDEPNINKNYNMESVLKTATAQPEGTNRKPGPGIQAETQSTYAAY